MPHDVRRTWGVAMTDNALHPASRMIDELRDALVDIGADVQERSALRGRVVVRLKVRPLRLPRRGGRDTLVLPLMGPEWWKLYTFAPQYDVVPFCWDVWPREIEEWCLHLRRARVRCVVVTSSQARDALVESDVGCQVVYVPEAASMSRFSVPVPLRDRSVDILELGRRYDRWHEVAVEVNEGGRFRHLYERVKGQLIFADAEALDDGLLDSRTVVCFPRSITHPESAGRFATLTQRYLEAAAAGCLIIGSAPGDLVDLFGYNPVVEVDWTNPHRQLLDVLENVEDHQSLVDRNRLRVSEVGSWTVRGPQLAGIVEGLAR